MRGPFVILGCPHSGTRVLAEVFERAGVFMGSDVSRGFRDSNDWYGHFVFPLIVSRYFPDWDRHTEDPAFLRFHTRRFRVARRAHLRRYRGQPDWGWKLAESAFVMPLIRQHLPDARFIHLIRDGRDVTLSEEGRALVSGYKRWRLRLALGIQWRNLIQGRVGRHGRFYRATCVNDPGAREWRGIDLRNGRDLENNRFSLQMQHWINSVTTARRYGLAMPEAYHELRYEDLVTEPGAALDRLLQALDLPRTESVRAFVADIDASRTGRWRSFRPALTREADDFTRAMALGQETLAALGYR